MAAPTASVTRRFGIDTTVDQQTCWREANTLDPRRTAQRRWRRLRWADSERCTA
jgi:hypothetical protein